MILFQFWGPKGLPTILPYFGSEATYQNSFIYVIHVKFPVYTILRFGWVWGGLEIASQHLVFRPNLYVLEQNFLCHSYIIMKEYFLPWTQSFLQYAKCAKNELLTKQKFLIIVCSENTPL